MMRWVLAFFIVAIIASMFGCGRFAEGSVELARVCFLFFIVIFLVSLVWGLLTGRRTLPRVY